MNKKNPGTFLSHLVRPPGVGFIFYARSRHVPPSYRDNSTRDGRPVSATHSESNILISNNYLSDPSSTAAVNVCTTYAHPGVYVCARVKTHFGNRVFVFLHFFFFVSLSRDNYTADVVIVRLQDLRARRVSPCNDKQNIEYHQTHKTNTRPHTV